MDIRVPMEPLLEAFGVAATVGIRWDNPVAATGIWASGAAQKEPLGLDHQRLDPMRVISFNREEVDKIPVGTIIEAPEKKGGENLQWRVDGVERMDQDVISVSVVEQEIVFG